MEEICYEKNPITEAIARIDFLNPLTELGKSIPKEIVNEIKKQFPIAEPNEIFSQELQISDGKKEVKNTKSTEWIFFSKDRSKRIVISENKFIVVHNVYDRFERFNKDFISIFDEIEKMFPSLQIKRFGLRYINNINFDEGDPFEWSNYLNNLLFAPLQIPEDKSLISRSFHNLQINNQDYNLTFHFGMHNPDFPATIKKKSFVLDFDAYFAGLLDKSELREYFKRFHKSIQGLFEKSITDEYRKILNDESEQ